MKLITDWYKPYAVPTGRCFYRVSAEAEAALGYAYSVLVQATGEFPPELSLPEDATDESKKAAREAWLEWKRDREETIEQFVADQMAFEALRCHIEGNILHYMRPIWLAEDPGQRIARLSRELLCGTGDEPLVARLIEQPLLGFHLNCSLFPVRLGTELEDALRDAIRARTTLTKLPDPEGPSTFVEMLSVSAKKLKTQVGDHFAKIADQRFQADGKGILDRSIRDSVRHVLTCKDHHNTNDFTSALTPEILPEVISAASTRIKATIKALKEKPSLCLSLDENRFRINADEHLEHLSTVQANKEATIDSLGHVLDAGNVADRVIGDQDFKPIMVTLPDGGYFCEPVLGHCSAAETFRQRTLEAETTSQEAFAKQEQVEADRRQGRLDAGQLDPEPSPPTLVVKLQNTDSD